MFKVEFDSINGLYTGIILTALLFFLICSNLIKSRLLKDWRWILLSALRLAIVAFLALVLAEPYLQQQGGEQKAALLIDVSESLEPGVGQLLLDKARTEYGSQIDLVAFPFAAEISDAALSPGQLTNYWAIRESWSKLDLGKTDMAQALQAVLGNSEFGSIILISDGFETKGSLRSLASAITQKRQPIFPLVTGERASRNGEFQIIQLHSPLIAKANSSVELRVTVENTTSERQSGRLEILHGEQSLDSQQLQLDPGARQVVTVMSDRSKEGINRILASLTPADQALTSSSRIAYLSGERRERILMLSQSDLDQRYLKQALLNQSYQLETKLADQTGPIALSDLSPYSLVILNNLPIQKLAQGAALQIAHFVKAGGGLLMIGGGQSFGLGGYRGTAIGDLLPVESLPPQTEQRRLNSAVALVLDKSSSMQIDNRIEFTREAAKEVVRSLKDDDYITIIGFATVPFNVLRLTKVSEARNVAINRIDRLTPFGQTVLLPALDEARRGLERAAAARKHMIILTDGKLPGDGRYFVELIKQLRLLGISTSTVLVGGEVDQGLLKTMASEGGGAFYHTLDPRSLPQIFLRDVKVATGEVTLKEQENFTVVRKQEAIIGPALKNFPPLKGYVETRLKAGADLELALESGSKSDPLLASWQQGKGKTAAFTSDANGRWSVSWIGWRYFQQFWTELLNSLRPESFVASKQIPFDLKSSWQDGALNLDLALYSDSLSESVKARIVSPDQKENEITFRKIRPGRYLAEWPITLAGKYEIYPSVAADSLTPVAFHLSGELFGERKGQGFNLSTLSWLAQQSGGKINPSAQDIKDSLPEVYQKKSISNWLMLAALMLFLTEIVVRTVLW